MFYSLIYSHPGASGHEFLLEFLRAVGHCYEKSYPDLFVLDMLKLNVPLLFAHSRSHLAVQSAADKDVHIKFITNLCEYILKNNMQEKLLGGMQTILVCLSFIGTCCLPMHRSFL